MSLKANLNLFLSSILIILVGSSSSYAVGINDQPAEFFAIKLKEIKKINEGDESASDASQTVRHFEHRDYAVCAQRAVDEIEKTGPDGVFFGFEYVYGVKCLTELPDKHKDRKKLVQRWSNHYFSNQDIPFNKSFHGSEKTIYLDHFLKLSELIFEEQDALDLKSEQIDILARNLERSKNSKIKKQLFLHFINKNDLQSAKDFIAKSDPELLDLATLEVVHEHFKDDVYADRIGVIKASKSEAKELKNLYQKNQYNAFLEKIMKSHLVIEDEINAASRELGWLFVRGKQDFRDLVIKNFENANINPQEFFWVLSNQGFFRDTILAYNNLNEKDKKTYITMALKAYLYSGQYAEGYKFIKSQKIIENVAQTRPTILYYSSLILLRYDKDKEALILLDPLIEKDTEYKLQAMYKKYNIYKDMKKSDYKAIAKDLVTYYPLTFYGIVVAHKENLTSVLPFINSKPLPEFEFNFAKAHENRKLKHLAFIFDNKIDHRFRQFVEDTVYSLSFESQIIWAYRFTTEDQPLNAIKLMNHVWNSRRDLIHPSIIPLAYPKHYLETVKKYSVAGIDPFLVLGLIRQESAFQKKAKSASSAMGLMQLLSATAKEMARALRFSKASLPWGLYQPEVNIRLGSYYLKRRVEAYKGHVPLALASYNVGPGRLQKWSVDRNTIAEAQENISNDSWKKQDLWVEEMPWEETRFYVKAVLRNYLLYKMFEDYKPFENCFRVWNCENNNKAESASSVKTDLKSI